MFNGILALGNAKKYTDDSLVGVGALKGKPCTVKSYRIDAGTNNTIITFAWIDDAGVEHTQEVTVKKGVDGEDGTPGADGADGAPGINGVDGEDGITPTLVIDPVTYHWIINDVDTGVVARGAKGDKGDHGDNYTKTSELVNDSGFITNTVNNLLQYYTKTQVDDIIANLEGIKFEIVTELPATPEANTIYLMESTPGSGVYVEYIYASGSWRPIGSTDVDLSNYWTKSQTFSREQVQALLNSYALTADTYTKAQVDAALNNKADNNNVYTRSATDTLLGYKADVATTYNKTQVNNLISDKADKTEVYTKTQIISLLDDKADVATTYTKTEVDGKLDDKADALPTVVKNRYLHTNDTTGDLEWTEVNDADIKVKENGGILNDEEDGLSIDCGGDHTIQFGVDSNGKAGYKLDGADSVTPFRNPQGDATAADVLTGKTFANADSDEVSGTMSDYSVSDYSGAASFDSTTSRIRLKVPSTGYYSSDHYLYSAGSDFGDATTANVLKDKTFTSSVGLKVSGNMTNYSTSDQSATASYDSTNTRIRLKVPGTGYYSSDHYLYSATSNFGNATAAQVLKDKTFTSTAGLKVSGTMANYSTSDYSATASFDTDNTRIRLKVPSTGYYSNSHYLYSAASDFGDAAAGYVLSGKTFTSTAGLKVSGSMLNFSSSSYSATASFDSTNNRIRFKIPNTGYYNSSYYLYSATSNFGNATAADVLNGKTFTSTAGLKVTGTATAVVPTWTKRGSDGGSTTKTSFSFSVATGKTSYTIPAGSMYVFTCITATPTFEPAFSVTNKSGTTVNATVVGYTDYEVTISSMDARNYVYLVKFASAVEVPGTYVLKVNGTNMFGAMAAQII